MSSFNTQITKGEVPYTPEEAGYESLYIDRLNDFIRRMIEDKIVQGGSYCLTRHGKTFARNAVGSLDYRSPEKPLLPDSIRRIASITKMFTATALFMLAERGYININDTVARHLPEFDTPLHKGITVYNLLTHTSGLLPDWGAFPDAYETDWSKYLDEFDGNWIKALLTQQPRRKPNEEWIYSSHCFCILGEIIQRISGKQLGEFVKENILNPLGMNETFYDLPDEVFGRVCVTNEHEVPTPAAERKSGPWSLLPQGGWGISSTLADINKFGRMLLNNGSLDGVRIVGRKSVENMSWSHLKHDNLRNYCWGADEVHYCGLGFEVMTNKPFNHMTEGTFGHEGAGVCWLYIDPKEDFVANVFMPYYSGQFNLIPIHNTKYVIWSGLL